MNLNSPVTNPLLTQGASSSVDARSLAALRTTSSRDPKAAIKETAKQFEAMFMQQLLKSMREAQAAMSSGMMDNSGTNLGNEMLDGEYAKQMSGTTGGLADVIARQLERQMGTATTGPVPLKPFSNAPGAAPPAAALRCWWATAPPAWPCAWRPWAPPAAPWCCPMRCASMCRWR